VIVTLSESEYSLGSSAVRFNRAERGRSFHSAGAATSTSKALGRTVFTTQLRI
jgi:hypothetical protein